MRITKLTITTITLMCLAVALPANDLFAQQRLVFMVAAENTEYTQQHTIDVGDISGHQVRVFENSSHLSQQCTRDQRDEDCEIVDPWHHRLHQQ